ncbi:MAG: sugar ABC transporter permease [Roseburia sp.]|nr:sugar ABC transporter permease [Roseburia sp.]MCM1279070.1 sugar ABC transporter permease [Robinsoniella sp.]
MRICVWWSNDRERNKKYSFLAVSFLGVAVFYIIPFFCLIYYSFVDNPVRGSFAGFENYIAILQNQAFLKALKNTAVFSALSVPSAVVLSLLMAIVLEKNIPGKSLFRTIFLSPLMVPSASIMLVWQVLFCYNGTINRFLKNLGQGNIDFLKSDYGLFVVLLLFLWKNLGYYMIIYMAALNEIPAELLEAARMDGGSGFQSFWYIKLPYLSPSIVFVSLMAMVGSFKIFKEVYLLAGAHPNDSLYLLQHFMNNTFLAFDYQKLATAAILMCIGLTLIISLLFFLENRVGRNLEG